MWPFTSRWEIAELYDEDKPFGFPSVLVKYEAVSWRGRVVTKWVKRDTYSSILDEEVSQVVAETLIHRGKFVRRKKKD